MCFLTDSNPPSSFDYECYLISPAFQKNWPPHKTNQSMPVILKNNMHLAHFIPCITYYTLYLLYIYVMYISFIHYMYFMCVCIKYHMYYIYIYVCIVQCKYRKDLISYYWLSINCLYWWGPAGVLLRVRARRMDGFWRRESSALHGTAPGKREMISLK